MHVLVLYMALATSYDDRLGIDPVFDGRSTIDKVAGDTWILEGGVGIDG